MIKEKKCKGINKASGYKNACGKLTPVAFLNAGLCTKCYADFIMNTEAGQIIFQKKILPKAKSIVKKQKKAKDKETADSLKSLSEWQKELQDEVNHIARLIDKDQSCISHNGIPKKPNGGHYLSVGSHPALRFNLLNIWQQCYSCNGEKGGKPIQYEDTLVAMYGREVFDSIRYGLPQLYPYLKLHQSAYPELIKKAREIVRELKKEDMVYTKEERLELRHKYNKQLGIYLKE